MRGRPLDGVTARRRFNRARMDYTHTRIGKLGHIRERRSRPESATRSDSRAKTTLPASEPQRVAGGARTELRLCSLLVVAHGAIHARTERAGESTAVNKFECVIIGYRAVASAVRERINAAREIHTQKFVAWPGKNRTTLHSCRRGSKGRRRPRTARRVHHHTTPTTL